MRLIMTRHSPSAGALLSLTMLLLGGCANMDVSLVPAEQAAANKVHGIRYYLPKPMLQVTPQSDGTISIDVIYLPDSQHRYAIQTSSYLSAYTFQLSIDQNGLLNSLEYKADTSAVGQQLAASTAAGAAQVYNMRASQISAQQTATNTAQGSVDTAQATADAAQAQLTADTTNGRLR